MEDEKKHYSYYFMNNHKIAFLIFVLIIFPIYFYAEEPNEIEDQWWYGGEARLAGLGGIQIALPDISNNFDLYGYGFTASIFMREKLQYLEFRTKFLLLKRDIYNKDFQFNILNPIIYHFTNNMYLKTYNEYKRYYYEIEYNDLISFYSEYRYNTAFDFAFKIFSDLSMGGTIKYDCNNLIRIEEYESYLGYIENNYNNRVQFGLGINKEFKINYFERESTIDVAINIENIFNTLIDDSTIEQDLIIGNIGASLKSINQIDLGVKYSKLFNVSFNDTKINHTIIYKEDIYSINFWGRQYFDQFIISMLFDFEYYNGISTLYNVWGLTYKNETFNLPIEVGNNNKDETYEFKFGIEYFLNSFLALRAGINSNILLTESGSNVNLSIGAGGTLKNITCDIAFEYLTKSLTYKSVVLYISIKTLI